MDSNERLLADKTARKDQPRNQSFPALGWETIRGQTEDNMETKQRTRR
jgi:hypothetical protein